MATSEQVMARTGVYSGVAVRISPYDTVPSNILPTPVPGDFQSGDPNVESDNTTITFDKPVDRFTITIKNSTKPGNRLIGYDKDGNVLIEHTFGYGSIFTVFGNVTTVGTPVNKFSSITPGLRRVELIPVDGDYVFYGDLYIRGQETTVVTNPPPDVGDGQVFIPIRMNIIAWPEAAVTTIPIRMNILPAVPIFDTEVVTIPTEIEVAPIPIPLERAIVDIFRDLTRGKIDTYFDDARELKTVLNFGGDYQALLTNWRRDPVDATEMLVKLYQPLPPTVEEKTLTWISREISPPLLDRISIFVTPEMQVVFFLRPPHRNIEVSGMYGISVDGKSLNELIPSGSMQISGESLSLNNSVLQQRYRTSLEGVELNVDYADYNNFVHFGSAANRLKVFREKLILLESINDALISQTAAASQSLSIGGVSHISGTAQYSSMRGLIDSRDDIIRGLDGYERFLYYDTGSFSGSISGQPEDPFIYVSDVSWPKSGGVVLSVTSSQAETFYTDQYDRANEYDRVNQEYLANNVPTYLLDDLDSEDYVTFLNLVGHHFDLVKLYVDDMTDIYDRDPNPDRGMAKDIIWNIGQSLGIQLPNQYAIKELVDYYTTEASSSTAINYAEASHETWKRFVHNQIFVSKAKGTIAGLQGLVNSYGIRPSIIRVRESLVPFALAETGSFESFEETTNVVALNGQQALTLPFGDTGLFSPYTIELRWGIQPVSASFTSSVLMHGTAPNDWSVVVVPTGSAINNKGTVRLLDSAGAIAIESSVSDFYSGDYYSLMIRQNDAEIDLYVKKYIDEQFEYSFEGQATSELTASLSQSANIVLGSDGTVGTGSVNLRLDEFRLWKEVITDKTFNEHTKFPGLYAGNTSGSALTNLLVRHSFNQAQDLAATSSLANETPNPNATGSLSASVASGFAVSASYPHSMEVATRQTERFVLNAGTQYGSNTVRIMPAPTFDREAIIVTGSSEIPVLNRERSIRRKPKGEDASAQPQIGFYLSLSETINDSILRSIGNIDLNQLIGDPSDVYGEKYNSLDALNRYYHENFAPTYSYKKFVQYTEDLLEGLFRQAEDQSPASGKILTGITTEPTILERSKVRLVRQPTVDGANTRIESLARQLLEQSGSYPSTRNVDAIIEQSGSHQASGQIELLESTISEIGGPDLVNASITNLAAEIAETTQSVSAITTPLSTIIDTDADFDLNATYRTYETEIELVDDDVLDAFYTPLSAIIGYEQNTGSIVGQIDVLDAIFDADIVYTDIAAVTSQSFLMPMVEPTSNFVDPRSRVYFVHPSGSYGILAFNKVRVGNDRLNDRGDWVKGDTYATNDVVTQTNQTGSAIAGNDKEFVCLTTTVTAPDGSIANFQSNVPPFLDTTNWVAVSYVHEETILVKKAIVSGSSPIGLGDVAIVEADNAGTPFVGYSHHHYRFRKDTSTGYVRCRYTGCKQTVDTTFDGGDPVEILPGSEAQLYVKDGTPVQSSNDEGGPILDVR